MLDLQAALSVGKIDLNAPVPSGAMVCLMLSYKYVQSIVGWVSDVLLFLQVSFWECMNETLEGEYEKL